MFQLLCPISKLDITYFKAYFLSKDHIIAREIWKQPLIHSNCHCYSWYISLYSDATHRRDWGNLLRLVLGLPPSSSISDGTYIQISSICGSYHLLRNKLGSTLFLGPAHSNPYPCMAQQNLFFSVLTPKSFPFFGTSHIIERKSHRLLAGRLTLVRRAVWLIP